MPPAQAPRPGTRRSALHRGRARYGRVSSQTSSANWARGRLTSPCNGSTRGRRRTQAKCRQALLARQRHLGWRCARSSSPAPLWPPTGFQGGFTCAPQMRACRRGMNGLLDTRRAKGNRSPFELVPASPRWPNDRVCAWPSLGGRSRDRLARLDGAAQAGDRLMRQGCLPARWH